MQTKSKIQKQSSTSIRKRTQFSSKKVGDSLKMDKLIRKKFKEIRQELSHTEKELLKADIKRDRKLAKLEKI